MNVLSHNFTIQQARAMWEQIEQAENECLRNRPTLVTWVAIQSNPSGSMIIGPLWAPTLKYRRDLHA